MLTTIRSGAFEFGACLFLLSLIAWIILPVRGDHDALFGNQRVFICMD
jgi:hypothetical protein